MTSDDHAKKIAVKFADLQRAAARLPKEISGVDNYWHWRNVELADAAINYANAVRNARRSKP